MQFRFERSTITSLVLPDCKIGSASKCWHVRAMQGERCNCVKVRSRQSLLWLRNDWTAQRTQITFVGGIPYFHRPL